MIQQVDKKIPKGANNYVLYKIAKKE